MFAWKMSGQIIKENPVIGVGIGHFGGAYGDAQAGYFSSGLFDEREAAKVDAVDHAFSEYIHITSEQGVLGLLLFLGLTLISLRGNRKHLTPPQYAIVSLLVFATASYPFKLLPFLILFSISLASTGNTSYLLNNKTSKIIYIILIVGGIIIQGFILKELPPKEQAHKSYHNLKRIYGMELYDGLADDYRELYLHMRYSKEYLFEYGRVLNKTGNYILSNEILSEGQSISSDPMFWNVMGNNYLALKEYRKAQKAYETAYHILPNRIYPLYLLTKLYFEEGDDISGLDMGRRVLDFMPKVESSATNDMKKEVRNLINDNKYYKNNME